MPVEHVVINASPFILFRSNLETLLPQLFKEIIVPAAVWSEVISGNQADRASICLPETKWVTQVNEMPDPVITAWDVGPGETSVISFALKNQGYLAMLDDAAARRCAHSFKIPTLGTAGLLLVAKKRGALDSVAGGLRAICDSGLWLSDVLTATILKEAGEDK